MNKTQAWLFAVSALLPALQSIEAKACSGFPSCGVPLLVAPKGEVPSNLTGMLVDPYDARLAVDGAWGSARAQALQLTLHAEAEPGAQLPIRVEPRPRGYLWVAFEQPLREGARYVLTVRESCEPNNLAQEVSFLAGAPELAPAGLGALMRVEPRNHVVPVVSGGLCSEDITVAVADVALVAAPHRSVANYRLMVDGELWSWQLSASGAFYRSSGTPDERPYWFVEPGTFRIFAECELAPSRSSLRGLAPGKHTLQVRGELLGSTPTAIESEPIEVELVCPEDEGADILTATTGSPPTVTTEQVDEPQAQTDAPPEQTEEQPERAPAERRPDSDGCSLAHEPRTGVAELGLLIGLGVLFARRTRRRGRSG